MLSRVHFTDTLETLDSQNKRLACHRPDTLGKPYKVTWDAPHKPDRDATDRPHILDTGTPERKRPSTPAAIHQIPQIQINL